MSSKKTSFLGIAVALSILHHALSGQLILYIHPRYVLFTVTMTVLGLILLLVSLVPQVDNTSVPRFRATIGFALLVALLLLPAQQLSARVARSRSQDQTSAVAQTRYSFDAFTRDFRHFDLQDWSTYLATRPSRELIIDKQAIIEGFIFEGEDDKRYIARFRVSCCAVDATPLTLPLKTSDQTASLELGAWYELTGTFIEDTSSGSYALELSAATAIPEPEEPYVY